MTLNDLKDEIAALGFDESVRLDKSLVIATNRALVTLYTERPVAKTVRLISNENTPLLYIPKITHNGGTDTVVRLPGRAYIFRVSGKGQFNVSDGLAENVYDFDTSDGLFRGTVHSEDAKIIFSGDYLYSIFSFTCYKEITDGTADSIAEYSEYREHDINAEFGDFLAFLEPPRQNGVPITDAVMQNGKLRIPYGKYGQIHLTYARMPKRVSADYPDSPIDISGECTPLLSLLVASYMWLDDDADRAQYYMSLYRNGMSFIRRYNTSISTSGYNDVLGWA